MLDYTLEWLSINGIEEIFILCCAHADQITAHLKSAGWLISRHPRIKTITAANCLSAGDALRTIDNQDIIKHDFVLVYGDVISNASLSSILDLHKKRRVADRLAIMTLVLRGGMSEMHRRRLGESGLVVAVDPSSHRLLKFEEQPSSSSSYSSASHQQQQQSAPSSLSSAAAVVRMDAAMFSERDQISLRTDLIDTGIAICAPEVLMLFSDNFDYQNIRKDFVTGVLCEEELGNKLYIHELTSEYAARVNSFRSYDAVSKDILGRWTYPLTPDTNLPAARASRSLSLGGGGGAGDGGGGGGVSSPTSGGGMGSIMYGFGTGTGGGGGGNITMGGKQSQQQQQVPLSAKSTYKLQRGRVYIESSACIARTAHILHDTCIGPGCIISDGAQISKSVLGKGCIIGPKAVLHGVYCLDNVTIGEGCTVSTALLCSGVLLKDNVTVGKGAVLSFGVVIDTKQVVPPHTMITLCQQKTQERNGGGGGGGNIATKFGSLDSCDDDDDDDTNAEDGFRPASLILTAAKTLASGSIPEMLPSLTFNQKVVGNLDAGFKWLPREPVLSKEEQMEEERRRRRSGENASGGRRSSIGGDGTTGTGTTGTGTGTMYLNSLTPPPPPPPPPREAFAFLDVIGAGAAGDSGALNASGKEGGKHSAAAALQQGGGGGGGGGGGALAMDMEGSPSSVLGDDEHFRSEVAETFLRCVKEGISHENVVIELNGLKIAEDKTFADCARFIFTTMLGLCLPLNPAKTAALPSEYLRLYPQIDSSSSSNADNNSAESTSSINASLLAGMTNNPTAVTREAKAELLKRASTQITRWQDLLQKFLKSEDDQVELLLTFEEYCGGEGDFEHGSKEQGEGRVYTLIFPQVLKVLYDTDVVSEEAVLQWADEKELADEEEKVYLKKAEPFIEWLRDAEEEESSEEEEVSE